MPSNTPFTWNELKGLIPEAKFFLESAALSPLPTASQIKIDSRSLNPGDWFLPIKGENFDGHNFFAEAISKNIGGIFCEKASISKLENLPKNMPIILVDDSLKALQQIAKGYRLRFPDLKIAAITGSTGKTSVKEMLRSILKEEGKPFIVTEGNFNNEIGLPLTLLRLKAEDSFAILEMGARHPGDIKFLMDIAQPQIGCLVNVGKAHLGIFGSFTSLLTTKWQVLDQLGDGGIAIINGDQEVLREKAQGLNVPKVFFGHHPQSTVRIENEKWTNGRLSLDLSFLGQKITLKPHSPHAAFAINAAASASIALTLGIMAETIREGLTEYKPMKGRFNIFPLGSSSTLIDDAYNANPSSMMSGLQTVTQLFTGQPLILVLGDMLELGDEAQSEHFKIGSWCGQQQNILRLCAVGSFAKNIGDGALSTGLTPKKISLFGCVEDLITDFPPVPPNAVIFIKGSNGMRLCELVEDLKMRYS